MRALAPAGGGARSKRVHTVVGEWGTAREFASMDRRWQPPTIMVRGHHEPHPHSFGGSSSGQETRAVRCGAVLLQETGGGARPLRLPVITVPPHPPDPIRACALAGGRARAGPGRLAGVGGHAARRRARSL